MLPDTLESSCNNRKPLEAYNYNFLLLIFSKYHHDADNDDDDDGGYVEAVKTGVGRSVRALETLLWPFVAPPFKFEPAVSNSVLQPVCIGFCTHTHKYTKF